MLGTCPGVVLRVVQVGDRRGACWSEYNTPAVVNKYAIVIICWACSPMESISFLSAVCAANITCTSMEYGTACSTAAVELQV